VASGDEANTWGERRSSKSQSACAFDLQFPQAAKAHERLRADEKYLIAVVVARQPVAHAIDVADCLQAPCSLAEQVLERSPNASGPRSSSWNKNPSPQAQSLHQSRFTTIERW